MSNIRVILTALGWLLAGLGALALLHGLGAGLARDGQSAAFGATAFAGLLTGGICLSVGWGAAPEFGYRQAVIVIVLAWFGLPVLAALPFAFGSWELSWVDAYFEAISGLTTTGSTVVAGLDTAPPSLLMWRSTLQWIGGIGIIGMSMAILPFLKVGGMQLFRLESSDSSSDRLIARPNQFVLTIGAIYVGLTLACVIAYGLTGMTGFEAVNHAFTTVSTGGYSTSDRSLGAFGPAAQSVSIVFMLAGALPFLAYVRLMQASARRGGQGFEEVRTFLAVVCVVALVLAVIRVSSGSELFPALLDALFNTVAVITTTGYASQDYSTWGPFAAGIFFFLIFVGGCSGSTSGGFKIFRFGVMVKGLRQTLSQSALPHAVTTARLNGRPLLPQDIASVSMFAAVFVASFGIGALALAATGLDLDTALSGSATALANVGPGLGPIIGPAGNFSSLPDSAKLVLSAIMVLGRLEIFTVLILFTPRFYTA